MPFSTDCFSIPSHKRDEVVTALVAALKDENAKVRLVAAEALVGIDGAGSKDALALGEALKDRESGVRQLAAEALGSLGEQARNRIPALLETWTDQDVGVRVASAESLGNLAPITKKWLKL
jgi:HEAT repeat protein